ncbi:UNVERIFIED_CONTAM: hypothetical protein FKN15_068958 [Acipenser sinensis]
MKEFGYDVEDFREIDPIFGTMEDFENLLSSIQDRGSYCFFVCALQDVIRIWLEKGVDGFQMDVVKFILEAEHLRRASGQSGAKPSDSCCTELCLERVNGSWRPKPTTTKYVNVINMLLLTLPGTPTSYYGEEIGMENTAVSEDHIQDPFGKFDPMQRNDSSSPLALYRTLTALRESELPLHRGWVCLVWSDADVFAFVRELDGLSTAFLIVLNLGNGSTTDLTGVVPELPREASVRVSTLPGSRKTVSLAAIRTETGEGLVLEYHTREPIHEVSRFRENCFVSEKACYFSALGILYKNC